MLHGIDGWELVKYDWEERTGFFRRRYERTAQGKVEFRVVEGFQTYYKNENAPLSEN